MFRENFPNATLETLVEKSDATFDYNCIAWTLGDSTIWWSTLPGYFWPPRTPRPMTVVQNVVEMYKRNGFSECQSLELEPGIEKIAIYSSSGRFKHAARQLESGKWTSKLAEHEDVEHDTAETLLGGEFESIARIMKRPRPS